MKTLRNITTIAFAVARFAGVATSASANPLAQRYSDVITELATTTSSKQQIFEGFCRLMRETFDMPYMTAYVEKESSTFGGQAIGQNIALGYIAAWALYKMDFLKEQREKRATLGYVLVGTEGTRKYGSNQLVKFKVRKADDADVSEIYIGSNGKIRNFGNSQGTILGNAPAELRPRQSDGGEGGGGGWDNASPLETAKKYIVDTVGSRYANGCP